jgi:ribonuclease MRP protein subunit RMP1
MKMNTEVSSIIKLSHVREEYNLIHLIFHRNKNQHQRSKWWRWLSKLKATISTLLSMASTQELVDRRLLHLTNFLRTHVAPRCYGAFSTLIAESQFSTLGAVLVASLARLENSINVDDISSRSSSDRNIENAFSFKNGESSASSFPKAQGESFDSTEEQASHCSHEDFETTTKSSFILKQKSSTKKKIGANAIDDIFDKLI